MHASTSTFLACAASPAPAPLVRTSGGVRRSDGVRSLIGVGLPTVIPLPIAYHDVKDKDLWLASNTREEFFGPLGVTNIRTFVDPTNPTRVGLLMDVSDLDAVAAALQTPEAAKAEAHDGVVSETIVILVEEKSAPKS